MDPALQMLELLISQSVGRTIPGPPVDKLKVAILNRRIRDDAPYR